MLKAVMVSCCLVTALLWSSSTSAATPDERPCLNEVLDHARLEVPPERNRPRGKVTFFLNFDGADLVFGSVDDAPNNQTSISIPGYSLSGPYPPYGAGTKADQIYAAVLKDFEDFPQVEITRERPANGPYTMAMIGPHALMNMGRGVSWNDCGNQNLDNVAFAFFGADDGFSVEATAKTISHEIGHTLGLEHTALTDAIMVQGGDEPVSEFQDACTQVVLGYGDNGYKCPSAHTMACEDAARQNSVLELQTVLGEDEPDPPSEGPLELAFTAPLDGDVVSSTEPIAVRLDAQGGGGIDKIVLRIDDKLFGTDLVAPYEWSIELEEGEHVLSAEATADDGQLVTASIAVLADDEPFPGGDGGTDDGGSDDGGSLPGPGADEMGRGGGGCGCSARSTPYYGSGLLLLGLLGWRGGSRRRRRNAA